MVELGQHHNLNIIKIVDFGVYLDAQQLGEVLLPQKYCPPEPKEGDCITVFLYLDSDDRPIATTLTPKASVGDFALLKAIDQGPIGAFLDWGLEKDILLPFSEQQRKIELGKLYLVHLYINAQDGRIVASTKLNRFLLDNCNDNNPFKLGQEVNIIIAHSTPLGYKAIVNKTHWGIVYSSDLGNPLRYGEKRTAYIKHIRKDGKIDLSLNNIRASVDQQAEQILAYLRSNHGSAQIHDKSEPQLINQLFKMSKKSFKRALGMLYKQGKVDIQQHGIQLKDSAKHGNHTKR